MKGIKTETKVNMFRRFADRVTSAVTGTPSSDDKVQTLQAMGFDAAQARNALHVTNGDIDQAATLLLASGGSVSAAAPPTNETIQNAIQESLQSEENRLFRQAQEASVASRTAAVARAGEAAARRAAESSQKFGNANKKVGKQSKQTGSRHDPLDLTDEQDKTSHEQVLPTKVGKPRKEAISQYHPQVIVPAKLQDKTKEEQILRCANRLKSHPLAVDTLHRALSAVQKDPANDKYRKIDKTSAGFSRTLEGVPGAEGLLLAMNFHTRGAYTLVLERHLVDQVLLYLGISALEGAKQSKEYIEAKKTIAFAKEIKDIQLAGNVSEAEALRRAEYMSKCPSEPTGGRGALMQVVIADETVRRRFDGDDVLRDVMNWIGGHGSVIPDKILSREWCLVDLNRYPVAPIDCQLNSEKTLQYIGCWPSGRLEIRPSPEAWRTEGNKGKVLMGSSRGLGSAPTAFLH